MVEYAEGIVADLGMLGDCSDAVLQRNDVLWYRPMKWYIHPMEDAHHNCHAKCTCTWNWG